MRPDANTHTSATHSSPRPSTGAPAGYDPYANLGRAPHPLPPLLIHASEGDVRVPCTQSLRYVQRARRLAAAPLVWYPPMGCDRLVAKHCEVAP